MALLLASLVLYTSSIVIALHQPTSKPGLDPDYLVNKTFKPRLGDDVSLIIHARGNPKPSYHWSHNGKSLNSTDENYTSILDLPDIIVDNFGSYNLSMRNIYGSYSTDFEVQADGPPEPVSNLSVTNINTTCAHINFVTGYNYNSTQTFIISVYDNELFNETFNYKDVTSGKGGDPFTCEICSLSEDASYSVIAVANNSHGESNDNPEAVRFSTDGKPEPDPDHPVNKTFKPRLGDDVLLIIHAKGNPIPSYHWEHNGKLLNSTDENYTSILDLPDIIVDNFGSYNLTIKNKYGSNSTDFELLADGPPEPVSNLSVTNINTTCAHINFVTGYNYNSTQTFIISVVDNEPFHDTKSWICKDQTSGKGGDPFTCEICSLSEDATYSVTVVANNSRGESKDNPEAVKFSTDGKPKQDPNHPPSKTTFKPRLGNNVTLSIQVIGNPPPTFVWLHNDTQIYSTDTNTNSSVDLMDIKVDDFGEYTLNVSNKEGYFTKIYEILADGPPEPVSNVSVTNMNSTCAHINFVTGYNYNSTQSFIISVYENGLNNVTLICPDLTSGIEGETFTCEICSLSEDALCSVTVVANNSHGESQHNPDAVKFSIDGKPKPDPQHQSNTTFKPRLGNNVTLSIEVVANPLPKFVWWHNSTQINSTDTNTSSSVDLIDITVDDFGEYVLNVSNEEGYFNTTYEILADAIKHTDIGFDTTMEIHNVTADGFGDYILNMKNIIGSKLYIYSKGPPEPVNNLTCSGVSDNSIELRWKTGFDYNNTQTFQVQGYVNNKPMQNIKDLKDTTKGKGGQEHFKLDNLESSSTYVIYLVATNVKGSASKSNEVAFTTKAVPSKGDGTKTAEIVGYVVGSFGLIVFIIAIVYVFVRCGKRTSEPKYQNLNETHEEGSQTHVSRYDDAASSLS